MNLSPSQQQQAWELEHAMPHHLLQMDSTKSSSGVRKFYQWLKLYNLVAPRMSVIEMGCGKGRNTAWLNQQGLEATGFDFSNHAIKTAQERFTTAKFVKTDATALWPWPDKCFDLGIDCFALTDIDSSVGRSFAIKQFKRVIKPGGYLCAYLMSDEDEYHAQLLKTSPAPNEPNAFLNPAGKFEKIFSESEIKELYQSWEIVEWQRISKTADFYGQSYKCKHHWLVLKNT